MIINEAIFKRLSDSQEIMGQVQGVYSQWRDDKSPAMVYEIVRENDDSGETYEGIEANIFELTISVVAEDLATATPIAASVKSDLHNADWIEDDISILGVFYEGESPDYIDSGTLKRRLAIIDLRFKLITN